MPYCQAAFVRRVHAAAVRLGGVTRENSIARASEFGSSAPI